MDMNSEQLREFIKKCLDVYKKCDLYIHANLRNEGFNKIEEMIFWTGFVEIKRDQFAEIAEKHLSPKDREKLSEILSGFKEEIRKLLAD